MCHEIKLGTEHCLEDSGDLFFLDELAGPPYALASRTAAPLYAALTSLINMKLAFQAGYLNPTLYKIGTNPGLYQRVFRDMADGVSNAYNGAPGYVAGAGWDACTGWGVVNGTELANFIEIESIHLSPNQPSRPVSI